MRGTLVRAGRRVASALGAAVLALGLAVTMTPAGALAPAGEAHAATTSALEGSAATVAVNRVSQDMTLSQKTINSPAILSELVSLSDEAGKREQSIVAYADASKKVFGYLKDFNASDLIASNQAWKDIVQPSPQRNNFHYQVAMDTTQAFEFSLTETGLEFSSNEATPYAWDQVYSASEGKYEDTGSAGLCGIYPTSNALYTMYFYFGPSSSYPNFDEIRLVSHVLAESETHSGNFRSSKLYQNLTWKLNGTSLDNNRFYANQEILAITGKTDRNEGRAKFIASFDTVNVSLNSAGGLCNNLDDAYWSTSGDTVSCKVAKGVPSFALPAATQAGYDSNGWYVGDAGPFSTLTFVNDDVSLTAKWSYNIAYKDRHGNALTTPGGSSNWTQPAYKGTSPTIGNVNGRNSTGYTASGWSFAPASDDAAYRQDRSSGQMSGSEIPSTTRDMDGGNKTSTVSLYLYETPNKYTVTYHRNEPGRTVDAGEVTATQQLTYDAEETLDPNQFKVFGYHFNGWLKGARTGAGTAYTDGKTGTFNMVAAGSVHLYAQWTADVYAVAFDANGGYDKAGTMDSFTHTYGDSTPAPACGFVRTGYVFDKWKVVYPDGYTQTADNLSELAVGGDLGKACPSFGDAVERTVILRAQWTRLADYTITYANSVKRGDVTSADADVAWASNSDYYPKNYNVDTEPDWVISQKPVRPGYTFEGFTIALTSGSEEATVQQLGAAASQASGDTLQPSVTIDASGGVNGTGKRADGTKCTYGNLTVTAHWEANSYSITYERNYGDKGSYNKTKDVPANVITSYQVQGDDKADAGIFDEGAQTVTIDWVPARELWYSTSTFLGWRVTDESGNLIKSDWIDGNWGEDENGKLVTGEQTITVQVGEYHYTGNLVCTALWKHVQVGIEAPLYVNFADTDASYEEASHAYDVTEGYDTNTNKAGNERVYLESKAVFKSYTGTGGSTHDFAIASVECEDLSTRGAGGTPGTPDTPDTPEVVSAAVDNSAGATAEVIGASDLLFDKTIKKASTGRMFWISNQSTVTKTGSNNGSEGARRYFGFDTTNNANTLKRAGEEDKVETNNGLIDGDELRVYVNEPGSEAAPGLVTTSGEDTVKGEDGKDIKMPWRKTTLYYGLDLSDTYINAAAVADDLGDGKSAVYKLVRLKFTFAPIV